MIWSSKVLKQLESTAGKLGPNWEEPYGVQEEICLGTYKPFVLVGKEVSNTWHVGNLRHFYTKAICCELLLFLLSHLHFSII